ncbi:MAG: putative endonuclease [Frankiales bacterium]|nr:putative endonuclease [Frankiales bacterium]
MAAIKACEASVVTLAAVDPSALPLEEVQALAVGAEKLAARLRGIASQALAEVDAREPEGAAWWWRDALGITGEAAGIAVRRARALHTLPAVADAVVDGRLSLEQAGALTPLVGRIHPPNLVDSQAGLIEGAAGRSVDAIGQWVRHMIALNSEADLEQEQRTAEAQRTLEYKVRADGTIRGRFVLSAQNGEPMLTVIEALSRREGLADTRTAGERRADGLVAVFEAAAKWADLPQTGGQRAQISYVMSAEWAARLEAAEPAVGAWTGPQTRDRLEAMCCDARISRVLLNGVGQVVGLESLKDEITVGQRRALAARDRQCVARGCTRPPAYCDAHHLVSREDGGPTTLDNLVLLCRRHHVMWHQGTLALSDLSLPWNGRPDDPRAGPLVA